MKRNQNRKLFKKKSRSNYKLGCIITIVILIPVLYGVYLYCQQFNTQTQKSNEPQVNTSSQIPSGRNLEIPVSLAPKQEQIIRHTGYTVSYNKDLKLPNWVSYELTRQETKGKEKRGDNFIADPLVKGAIATNADYARSGYDKGHMAPAADMKWSPDVMKESFYFSNMSPQHPRCNRATWKYLEEQIREWAKNEKELYVICGPIFAEKPITICNGTIPVPLAYFKVVYDVTPPEKMIAFIIPNWKTKGNLQNFTVTVEQVEKITGFNFFSNLPEETQLKLETTFSVDAWIWKTAFNSKPIHVSRSE